MLIVIAFFGYICISEGAGSIGSFCFPSLLLAVSVYAFYNHWFRPRTAYPPAGHCRRCGYNLTGNVSGVCPECGTPVPEQGSAGAGDGVN
jgi:hypothetical protein